MNSVSRLQGGLRRRKKPSSKIIAPGMFSPDLLFAPVPRRSLVQVHPTKPFSLCPVALGIPASYTGIESCIAHLNSWIHGCICTERFENVAPCCAIGMVHEKRGGEN